MGRKKHDNHICPKCLELPTGKGYCHKCMREYMRDWRHRLKEESKHLQSGIKGNAIGQVDSLGCCV